MEVAIDHDPDVVRGHTGGGERLVQGAPHGVVELFHLLVTLGDTRVEQDQPVGVIDQVAADDDLLPRSRIAVVRHREVTEMDASDAVEGNHRARNSSGQSRSC